MNYRDFINSYTGNISNRYRLIKESLYSYEIATSNTNWDLLHIGLGNTAHQFAKYIYETCLEDTNFWYDMKLFFNGEDNVIGFATRIHKKQMLLSTYHLNYFFKTVMGPNVQTLQCLLKNAPHKYFLPKECRNMGAVGEQVSKGILKQLDMNVGQGSKLLIYEIPNCATTPDFLMFDKDACVDFTRFEALTVHCTGVVEVKSTKLRSNSSEPKDIREFIDLLSGWTKFKGMLILLKKYKPIPYWMSQRNMMNDLHVLIEKITLHHRDGCYISFEIEQIWINLVSNTIGRQILGQLMAVASLQRYSRNKLNACLSLVFFSTDLRPEFSVCLHFTIDCSLLKRVNEDIGNRIFDAEVIELARNHLQ